VAYCYHLALFLISIVKFDKSLSDCYAISY
jgi:hypothetical protein